jgi:hypothetical protein
MRVPSFSGGDTSHRSAGTGSRLANEIDTPAKGHDDAARSSRESRPSIMPYQ